VKISGLRKSNPSPKPTFKPIESFLEKEQTDEYSAVFKSDDKSKRGLNRDHESQIMSAISLAAAGYGDCTFSGKEKDDSLKTVNIKDNIIQGRVKMADKDNPEEFVNIVYNAFKEYITYHI